jgi:hypothetical protein
VNFLKIVIISRTLILLTVIFVKCTNIFIIFFRGRGVVLDSEVSIFFHFCFFGIKPFIIFISNSGTMKSITETLRIFFILTEYRANFTADP